MSIFKSTLIAAAACCAAVPSYAGVFTQVESSTNYYGDERLKTTTDVHIGYQTKVTDLVSLSVQAGPAFIAAPSTDTEHEISGKVELNISPTDKLNVYGEVKAITEQRDLKADFPVNLKVGAKYSF